jgi:hypothetical protein
MRRTLLKIAIFALTLSLGIGISIGWQMYQWSLVPYEISPTPPWPFAPKMTRRVYKLTNDITIVTESHACGPQANFHTVQLADGSSISQSYERFSSTLAASRALKARLGNAEIVERSPERDDNGLVIGAKILTAGPRVMRLSIHGNSLSTIEAPSLLYLQLYESGAFR